MHARCARAADARIACARVSWCARAVQALLCKLSCACMCVCWCLHHACGPCAVCRLCVHCTACVCDGALSAARPRLSRRALAGGAAEVVGNAMEVPAVHLQHSAAAGFYPRRCEVCGRSSSKGWEGADAAGRCVMCAVCCVALAACSVGLGWAALRVPPKASCAESCAVGSTELSS